MIVGEHLISAGVKKSQTNVKVRIFSKCVDVQIDDSTTGCELIKVHVRVAFDKSPVENTIAIGFQIAGSRDRVAGIVCFIVDPVERAGNDRQVVLCLRRARVVAVAPLRNISSKRCTQ